MKTAIYEDNTGYIPARRWYIGGHRGTLLVILLLALFAKMVHFAHATPSQT